MAMDPILQENPAREAVMIAFFILPVGILFIYSFWKFVPGEAMQPALVLDNYLKCCSFQKSLYKHRHDHPDPCSRLSHRHYARAGETEHQRDSLCTRTGTTLDERGCAYVWMDDSARQKRLH
jgi:hypothetical protein